jgi:hypothetical protein
MNDDDDLDEDIVTNKLLDELGLPPTEANIERVQRSLAFKIRMIEAKVAVVGASVAEKQRRLLPEMRRRGWR